MIVYFTGTGNSRFLAQRMGRQLGDEVVDAAKLIKEEKYPTLNSDVPFVFIAPVYAWRLPRLFEDWISKCSFNGDRHAYFVMDCGDSIGNAGSYAEKLSLCVPGGVREHGYQCGGRPHHHPYDGF